MQEWAQYRILSTYLHRKLIFKVTRLSLRLLSPISFDPKAFPHFWEEGASHKKTTALTFSRCCMDRNRGVDIKIVVIGILVIVLRKNTCVWHNRDMHLNRMTASWLCNPANLIRFYVQFMGLDKQVKTSLEACLWTLNVFCETRVGNSNTVRMSMMDFDM